VRSRSERSLFVESALARANLAQCMLTAAATDTFSDSVSPNILMVKSPSEAAETSLEIPCDSLPNTSAVFTEKSARYSEGQKPACRAGPRKGFSGWGETETGEGNWAIGDIVRRLLGLCTVNAAATVSQGLEAVAVRLVVMNMDPLLRACGDDSMMPPTRWANCRWNDVHIQNAKSFGAADDCGSVPRVSELVKDDPDPSHAMCNNPRQLRHPAKAGERSLLSDPRIDSAGGPHNCI
jgi:hypothetical protein